MYRNMHIGMQEQKYVRRVITNMIEQKLQEKMMDDITKKLEEDVFNIFCDWQEKLNITDGETDPFDTVELDCRIRKLAVQIISIMNQQPRDEKMVMNELLFNRLKEHYGHKVEIAMYGNKDNPANITLEDVDTNEVILDAEICTICDREDI